jgi:hypothetical protein
MNIPAGARVVPSVQTFCEWLVKLNGQVATCVEASEMVVDHIASRGRIPVSTGEDTALAEDLIARHQASPNGATNYLAASEQMTRLGIPNTAYGPDWFAQHDFAPLARAAIDRGVAVLFGVYAAHNLYDDLTHQAEDAGVDGHGIALVGYVGDSFLVADPNTSQALNGELVQYSVADLHTAFGGFPSMVIPEVSMSTPLDGYFTIANGSYTLKSDPSIVLSGGEATLFQEVNGCIGLPKGQMDYSLQGKLGVSPLCFRRYERAIVVYDPGHHKDAEPAFGDFYLGHIDDPDFGLGGDDEGAEVKAQAALQAEVSDLQAKLAAKPKVDPAIVSALTSASQVLSPIGAAAAEVAAALKVVGA